MADTQKTTRELNIIMEFADNDDRTLKIENPLADTDELTQKVKSLQSELASGQVLIGDKTGAAFSRIKEAEVVEKTVTYFDLKS